MPWEAVKGAQYMRILSINCMCLRILGLKGLGMLVESLAVWSLVFVVDFDGLDLDSKKM